MNDVSKENTPQDVSIIRLQVGKGFLLCLIPKHIEHH
jgi:hypothetical protein